MQQEQQAKSFRDLIVWHRSIELCVAVYDFTRSFPSDELYGLRSQLRRAAVSVSSNIAEGCGRLSTGEYMQFVGHARGSVFEVQTQLEISSQLHFGNVAERQRCMELSNEVGRMLNSLMASLKARKNPTPHPLIPNH